MLSLAVGEASLGASCFVQLPCTTTERISIAPHEPSTTRSTSPREPRTTTSPWSSKVTPHTQPAGAPNVPNAFTAQACGHALQNSDYTSAVTAPSTTGGARVRNATASHPQTRRNVALRHQDRPSRRDDRRHPRSGHRCREAPQYSRSRQGARHTENHDRTRHRRQPRRVVRHRRRTWNVTCHLGARKARGPGPLRGLPPSSCWYESGGLRTCGSPLPSRRVSFGVGWSHPTAADSVAQTGRDLNVSHCPPRGKGAPGTAPPPQGKPRRVMSKFGRQRATREPKLPGLLCVLACRAVTR